jgi:hypothetical protein
MGATEYKALPAEQRAVGIIGVTIFNIVLLSALYSYYFKCRNKSRKFFYILMILLGIVEQPRYIYMAIDGKYTNQPAYSMHFAGNFFYFSGSVITPTARTFSSSGV